MKDFVNLIILDKVKLKNENCTTLSTCSTQYLHTQQQLTNLPTHMTPGV